MIWNALTHMNTQKILTHLVHYRLFGKNHFCWQWYDEHVRHIFKIDGQLFYSLIEAHTQCKSFSATDVFVPLHNKKVITSWGKKSLLVTFHHSSSLFCFFFFLFLFQLFLKTNMNSAIPHQTNIVEYYWVWVAELLACLQTHAHMYAHTHACAHACRRTRTHMNTRMHAHPHTRTQTHTYTIACARIYKDDFTNLCQFSL